MNKKIAALSLASLLVASPVYVLASEQNTAGSAAPPTAMPGVNQSKSSKANDEKDQDPSPFSVEEIEAEFARLLGRSVDRKP